MREVFVLAHELYHAGYFFLNQLNRETLQKFWEDAVKINEGETAIEDWKNVLKVE